MTPYKNKSEYQKWSITAQKINNEREYNNYILNCNNSISISSQCMQKTADHNTNRTKM